ncbi:hypothetical protein DYB28_006182, partial [Aphanomyces astaci]
AYGPILRRRIHLPFTQEQKDWQQIRRGRYVEFNVMYDRGTKPKPDSWEARTLEVLKNPVDWLDVDAVDLQTLSTKELLKEIARRSETQ